MNYVFRNLTSDEIEVRYGKGNCLLLYQNSRIGMQLLDEVVGQGNWQRDHKELKENIYCGVSVWDADKNQWVTKWDAGTETAVEAVKGEASDSFKRACVCWGIGRALYQSPHIYCDDRFKADKFRLSEITYSKDGTCVLSVSIERYDTTMKKWIKFGDFNNKKIARTEDELKTYIDKMKAAKTNEEVMSLWKSLTKEKQEMPEYKEPCIKKCNELKAA